MSDKEMLAAADHAIDVLQAMGDRLAELLKEVLELYERAECVGPTRQERERINEIRKMVRMPPMREDYAPPKPAIPSRRRAVNGILHPQSCDCGGEGWLWGHELKSPPEVVTDTRYRCDRIPLDMDDD